MAYLTGSDNDSCDFDMPPPADQEHANAAPMPLRHMHDDPFVVPPPHPVSNSHMLPHAARNTMAQRNSRNNSIPRRRSISPLQRLRVPSRSPTSSPDVSAQGECNARQDDVVVAIEDITTTEDFLEMTAVEKLAELTGLAPGLLEQPFLLPAHDGDWKCTLRTVMDICQPSFLSSSLFTEEHRNEFDSKMRSNKYAIKSVLSKVDSQCQEVTRRFYLPEGKALKILRSCNWDMEVVAAKVNLKKNHPLSEHPQLRSVLFSFLDGAQLGKMRLSNSHICTSVEQHVLEQSVEFVTYLMAEPTYLEPTPVAKRKKEGSVQVPRAWGRDVKDKLYCGRFIGRDKLPGSDGRCGVDNGPNCHDCQLAQRSGIGASCNRGGFAVAWGNDHHCKLKLYCGRFVGYDNLPGSDGHCGPDNGPQCQNCAFLRAERVPLGAPREPPSKNKLCMQWAMGTCTYGDRCAFVHGPQEMNTPVQQSPSEFSVSEKGELIYQSKYRIKLMPPGTAARNLCDHPIHKNTGERVGRSSRRPPAEYQANNNRFSGSCFSLCRSCYEKELGEAVNQTSTTTATSEKPPASAAQADENPAKVTTVPFALGLHFLKLLASLPWDHHTDFMRQCCTRLGLDVGDLLDVTLVDKNGKLEEVIPTQELEADSDGGGTNTWAPEFVCPQSVRYVLLQFPIPVKHYGVMSRFPAYFKFRHWVVSWVEDENASKPMGFSNFRPHVRAPPPPPPRRRGAQPLEDQLNVCVQHATVYLSRAFSQIPTKHIVQSSGPLSLQLCALPGPGSEQLTKVFCGATDGQLPVRLDVSGIPNVEVLTLESNNNRPNSARADGKQEIILPQNGATVKRIDQGEIYRFANFETFDLKPFVKLQALPSRFLRGLDSVLVSVDLGSPNLMVIENRVLEGCGNLRSISLLGATTLTEIGSDFAADCASLRSITFPAAPNQLTRFGERSFSRCPLVHDVDVSSLTALDVFPDSMFIVGGRGPLSEFTPMESDGRRHHRYPGDDGPREVRPLSLRSPKLNLPAASSKKSSRLRTLDITMLGERVCGRSTAWRSRLEEQGTSLIVTAAQVHHMSTKPEPVAERERVRVPGLTNVPQRRGVAVRPRSPIQHRGTSPPEFALRHDIGVNSAEFDSLSDSGGEF